MGHEAGLLLCSWPRGGKPTLPFIYSDEVWTGIEYQVASHLILEGFVREGLDPSSRRPAAVTTGTSAIPGTNTSAAVTTPGPWPATRCSASLSGFRYSAVEKTLWFGPKLKASLHDLFFHGHRLRLHLARMRTR
jgi:non-lysosomal glucosylceramidase